MSLVCFPFKEEDVTVAVRNVEIAASHKSIACVLGVGYSRGETWHAIEAAAPGIEKRTGKKIVLLVQQRLGKNLRPGKGDGMNTALSYFLDCTYPRLHFYDADIVSFSHEWITKAESQADLDFDVVRHYFPRSSTDAMITWFVTKIGFALLWPNSVLPHIEQPLGGELLLTRKAANLLMSDHRVRTQSDWGIDTLYTFVTAQAGLRVAEVYIAQGKVHALYSGLSDLRRMLVECFSAVQTLKSEKLDDEATIRGVHRVEFPKPVPESVKQKIGYDVEKTLKLLRENWTQRQRDLLKEHFDPALAKGLLLGAEWPCWSFCDEEAWKNAYVKFLDNFEKGDDDWEELLFKVWVARVLNHTMRNVMRGYDFALGALKDLVRDTQHRSAEQMRASAAAKTDLMSGPMSGHSAVEGKTNGHARKRTWAMAAGADIAVQQ